MNSQLPIIIIEEKKKKSLISNENEKIEVEKEEEKIEEEYTQKRSKTYFKRGDMQKPMIEKQVEREEIVVVPKSIDYHYIEYLLKPLEEDLNDVVLGYLKKIVSEFLTRKPLEVRIFFIFE